MKKKSGYWFYIDSYVHIAIKQSNVLFYNTYTGGILEYKDDPVILKLSRRLHLDRNHQVIHLTPSDLKNPVIAGFVDQIRQYMMGDLIDVSLSELKPMQQVPIKVKIQNDVRYLTSEEERSVGEEMMSYLNYIHLYLNDSCLQSCDICDHAYRQAVCCHAQKNKNTVFPIELLEKLVSELQGCTLRNFIVTGGNILNYPYWERMESLLDRLNVKRTYVLHYMNALEDLDALKRFAGEKKELLMPVTFPYNREELIKALEAAMRLELNFRPVFIICNEEEYEQAEGFLNSFSVSLSSFEFNPVYNGDNLEFFRRNLYITPEDIDANQPSQRIIYVNGAINSFYFGKIVVMPDGSIYADENGKPLAEIRSGSVYEAVYREMMGGKTWRKIRGGEEPCKRCVYELLCPSLVSYNQVIGRADLCWKQK